MTTRPHRYTVALWLTVAATTPLFSASPPARIARADALRPARAGDGAAAGVDSCAMCPRGRMACGDTVTGRLTSECVFGDGRFFECWSFRVEEPTLLTVELTSVPFDTYLYIADADCFLVGENDDCEVGNFDLSCVTVNVLAGEYTLMVTSYAAGETGPYSLSTTCETGVDPCVDCAVGTIACGESLEDRLEDEGCVLPGADTPIEVWTFALESRSAVVATLDSTEFDPVLLLFDADCGMVA